MAVGRKGVRQRLWLRYVRTSSDPRSWGELPPGVCSTHLGCRTTSGTDLHGFLMVMAASLGTRKVKKGRICSLQVVAGLAGWLQVPRRELDRVSEWCEQEDRR
ncbi:hypothetical protein BRADI_2g12105v3 [Brachypodium distachyon]|uniref:Uncharacterized protein n=1 Tax=Brachypodium distachyon TaxID=15368 RepID=A0A0Q3FXJ9_BRADI|nr:hypothetical protein BRADI_2g12105v3 [Brachypodium distachyon]